MQRERFYVLGVPVDFETNQRAVLLAVAACLSARRPDCLQDEPDPDRIPVVRLRLNDRVKDTSALRFHTVTPHRLEIEGPGFAGRSDAETFTAECDLISEVLNHDGTFRDTILATLALFLVARLDRQPFHAAALQFQGRGVLLSGLSGTGKSTLAYAAQRRGWRVLTDDAVYLQHEPVLRIWARPAPLHLQPNAARWFDELAGREPVLRDNGKRKLRVCEPAGTAALVLDNALVCLLRPGSGPPELRPLGVEDALTTLLRTIEPGFSLFRDTIGPVLRDLLERDGARVLFTGNHPDEAIAALERELTPAAPDNDA